MDRNQQALAAEIRAEMGAQNLKAAPIQRALGISSTAWGTYFVQCTRDVPMSVVAAVAEYLGLATSELLRRAEDRAARAEPAPDLSEHITRQLSPEAQAQVRLGLALRRGQGSISRTSRFRLICGGDLAVVGPPAYRCGTSRQQP